MGYRIILDEDREEAGVLAVNNGKILVCKSRSFPFMSDSEHSSLFYLKTEPMTAIWEDVGI